MRVRLGVVHILVNYAGQANSAPLHEADDALWASMPGPWRGFTPTGYGTELASGKETRRIDGRDYVLEYPIRADFELSRPIEATAGQPRVPQGGAKLRHADGDGAEVHDSAGCRHGRTG